jgi:NAD(P)-dependent dehydrogenase (short-subunit alcohol dehydrogenase family)
VTPHIPTPEEFRGRVALVTGGTDGLGRHLTLALASLGCLTWFCGRNEEKGRAVEACSEGNARFFRCDLTSADETAAFVTAAASERGSLDYVVNNAAMDPRIPIAESTVEDFDRMVATNLRSYYVVSREALPWLREGAGKAIVNIGTTNFMLGLAPFALYAAAKSGIVGFTRALAREVGPDGVRVNLVSPGWIMTEKQLREYATEEDKAGLVRDQSLKFLLTDEHVTPATLFLLSRAACGITGQNLVVDGGKFMQ